MDLQNPTAKMSKSDPSEFSRLNMTDSADDIAGKIRKATTDPNPLPDAVAGLEGRAEAQNLLSIYAALTDTDHAAVLREHGGKGFGAFKPALTELVVSKLAPIADETNRLLADPATIEAILRDGARRAEALAVPIVEEAERLVGFLKV